MIDPGVDVNTSTDAEIIAAYLAQGMSEDTARTYLHVLRAPDPEIPLD